MHARFAPQGVHAQAGVIGERRQAGQPRGVAGFLERVFNEGAVWLFGFRYAQLPLRDQFPAER